jgi:thioredoxin reductase
MTMAIEAPSYDVVVVGGGAAGLSAALVLGRARRRVAVVDAGAPRNAPAAHMQGFLSRDGMAPNDLLAAGRAEVTSYGVKLVEDHVVAIDTGFVVRLAGGPALNARRILIATGIRDELPDIRGIVERWGRDLLHCPYCHGWEVRDQPVGVLGTLPGSVQHAQLVRQWSDDVAFFVHTYDLTEAEQFQLEARGIRIVRGEVARLVVEDDRLTGVELKDGRVIARSAVFVRPGNVPHADGLLTGLHCDVDEAGFATVDATGRTSILGVWAAGNVVDPRAQVITAAGAGSAAAIAINADLVQEDVERAAEELRVNSGAPLRRKSGNDVRQARWERDGRAVRLPRVLLHAEGIVVAVAALVLYFYADYPWWLLAALVLAPDLSMVGYLAGSSIGAAAYDAAHTYALPVALAAVGLIVDAETAVQVGLIWLTHIAVDRALGYGLKYPTGFKDTHLQRV